jgi:hypothetical protein
MQLTPRQADALPAYACACRADERNLAPPLLCPRRRRTDGATRRAEWPQPAVSLVNGIEGRMNEVRGARNMRHETLQ